MAKKPRISLPASGTPNSTETIRDKDGSLVQVRYYDDEGKAAKNIDHGHDHSDAGDPHVHDWDWSKSPPRQPSRPMGEGE
jgi:hypothetical protein